MTSTDTASRDRQPLLVALFVLILAAGFAVRLRVYEVWHYVGSADQTAYLDMARDICAGRMPSDTVFTPGFPALIATALRMGVPLERAGQVVTLLAGLAGLVLIWFIGSRLYSRRAGLVAMAIAAIHPDLVRRSTNGMTEMPYVAVMLAAIALLIVARDRALAPARWLLFCAAGASLSLLYLIRPEGIGIGALMALAVFLWSWDSKRVGAAQMTVVLSAMMALALPYLVILHAQTGQWQLSGKQRYNLGLDERTASEVAQSATEAGGNSDRTGLGAMARRLPRNLAKYLRRAPADFDGPLLFAMAALGLLGAPWTPSRWRTELLLIAPFATMAIASVFFYNSRFVMPTLAIVAIWAGQGLIQVGEWARASFGSGKDSKCLECVAAAMLCAVVMPNAGDLARLWDRSEVPFEEKPAATWLQAHAPAGSKLMSGKTMVPFYAQLPAVLAPHGDVADVRDTALREGARYLVVGERQDTRWWPTLTPFMDLQRPPPGFSLVYVSSDAPHVYIYRVAGVP